jgi:hypothetical protein
VTGNYIRTSEPLNLVVVNVNIDTYGLYNGFVLYYISCNYPEAYQTPIVYFENLTVVTSTDRKIINNPQIVSTSIPANVTYRNVDITDFYSTLSYRAPTFDMKVVPVCIPDDGLVQLLEFTNLTFGLTENDSGQKF